MPGTLPRAAPLHGQPDLVEIVHHDLGDGRAWLEPNEVWPKASLHVAQVAHVEPFADDHHAPARAAQLVVHLVGQLGQRAGAFGQVDLQRHLALGIGQPGGRRNEADLAAHRLHHQHRIGRAGAGVLLVGVLDHVHPVAGHRAVAGRVVDQPELAVAHVVVDRLGHADGHQVQPALVGQLGDLVGRVHRVVAADVEQIADLVGPQDLDHPLEILGLARLELVAAGADRAGRRRESQQGHLLGRLGREVEQFLLQHALDAVPGPVDRADGVELAGRLDDPPQAAVDDRRRPAALGDDQIPPTLMTLTSADAGRMPSRFHGIGRQVGNLPTGKRAILLPSHHVDKKGGRRFRSGDNESFGRRLGSQRPHVGRRTIAQGVTNGQIDELIDGGSHHLRAKGGIQPASIKHLIHLGRDKPLR